MGRLGVHVARAQSWDRARQTARRDERGDDPRQRVIRDSGARDARCPCGGGEPRFGTACFPRLAALARISHQDPGPSVPPARCATRSGPARRPPRRRRGCALRGWPLPRALRPGPCPSPAHTQRCNFAIASRFRDPTPCGASRRRARRGFPSSPGSRVMAHGHGSCALLRSV